MQPSATSHTKNIASEPGHLLKVIYILLMALEAKPETAGKPVTMAMNLFHKRYPHADLVFPCPKWVVSGRAERGHKEAALPKHDRVEFYQCGNHMQKPQFCSLSLSLSLSLHTQRHNKKTKTQSEIPTDYYAMNVFCRDYDMVGTGDTHADTIVAITANIPSPIRPNTLREIPAGLRTMIIVLDPNGGEDLRNLGAGVLRAFESGWKKSRKVRKRSFYSGDWKVRRQNMCSTKAPLDVANALLSFFFARIPQHLTHNLC